MHKGASPHWENMWGRGLRPGQAFDVGRASPTLTGCLSRKQYATRGGMRALVPGCGRAYDALALAKHGFDEVVALDLAPSAVAAAKQFLAQSTEPAAAKVLPCAGDFFRHEGQYDLIYDCTFLCALDPSVRQQWATTQRKLLAEGGTLVCCVFPIRPADSGGPPYAMSVELVRGLLEPQGFACEAFNLPESERHMPGPGTALLLATCARKPTMQE